MKKRNLSIVLLLIILVMFSSCTPKIKTIEHNKLKNLCQLSTLECRIHSFIKSDIEKRKLLGKNDTYNCVIEYDGIFSVGLDFIKLEVDKSNSTVTVYISQPYLVDYKVDTNSLPNYPALIYDNDNILAETKTLGVNECNSILSTAQEELREHVETSKLNYEQAEENAKKLIESYIRQIGISNGVEYVVNFSYSEEQK